MTLSREALLNKYHAVRHASKHMVAPLSAEQLRIQSMPDVSPAWWNLAHTSWFWARNLLEPLGGQVTKEDELFNYVLNSYYVSLGPRLEREKRGVMTRPTAIEVYEYRDSIDQRVEALIQSIAESKLSECEKIINIGINHEQQHQELFYTEIKHILYQNPLELRLPYLAKNNKKTKHLKSVPATFLPFKGGLYEFGKQEESWGWDNELPIHKYYLNDFQLMNRLVTNGEYLEFMLAGGYENQLLWLDNGWNACHEKWHAPLYWEKINGEWHIWTLTGMQPLDLDEPVCHVSFYEAEAYATWKCARLPTEREWEHAARIHDVMLKEGNFLDSGHLHPTQANDADDLLQMAGDVWEWTSSYYEPYPGYIPFEGVLCEYNEKFMDNQRVLRGGSCVSERNHLRISYRNFWAPTTRFQFTGIRLAKNL